MDSSPDFAEFDRAVGRTLRTFRRVAEMSQGDLAAAMTARGVPIAQQVLTKIERGVRPLRFDEAMCAATVLRVQVSALADPAYFPEQDGTAFVPPDLSVSTVLDEYEKLRDDFVALEAKVSQLTQLTQPMLAVS